LTTQIDNFTITETSDKVVVDYSKTIKDWFDTLITLSIGLFACVLTFLFLRQGLKTTSFTLLFASLVLSIAAIYQTISGIFRLFQPTKNILVIDKMQKTILTRNSPFASKTFSLEEVQTIVVSGQNEKVTVGGGQKMTRTFCTISAKLKGKEDERLLTINTNRFIRPSAQTFETELYSKAKRLTSEINRHLKSKYQWTGYNEN